MTNYEEIVQLRARLDAALAEQAVLDAKYVDERAAKDSAISEADQYFKCLQIEKHEHAVAIKERDELRRQLDESELLKACKLALNFLLNTQDSLGIAPGSSDELLSTQACRNAISKAEGRS